MQASRARCGRAPTSVPIRGRRTQRGFASLTLALTALFGTVILAGPMLARASLGLRSPEAYSPLAVSSTASSAEHGLWRIEHDPDFLDSMIGSPPSGQYTLDLPDGTATVTVTASSDPPAGDGLRAALTVAPAIIPPDAATVVTFTMTVVNDDTAEHQISRVEANPRVFSPQYVAGSTSGFTDIDPTYTAGRWRWSLLPYAVVGPFGGEATMSWQMEVQEAAGSYWTAGNVRVEAVGTVSAPLTANVRVADLADIDISVSVAPSQVSAGSELPFDYTIVVSNGGAETLTLEWIKQFSSRDLDYEIGSSSGVTTADPHRSHDVINDRWVHTWDVEPTPLEPAAQATLTFRMQGSLLPGTYFAAGSARVLEDLGGGQDSTVSTGETAPIVVRRSYDIHVELNGHIVDVTAMLGADGVDVLSWVES